MYNREKKEKTENNREKMSSGCFSFLNSGWRVAEIAALSGVKPNFGGGGIRADMKSTDFN